MVFSSKTFKNRVRKSRKGRKDRKGRKTVRKGKTRVRSQRGGNRNMSKIRGLYGKGVEAGPMPWLDPSDAP